MAQDLLRLEDTDGSGAAGRDRKGLGPSGRRPRRRGSSHPAQEHPLRCSGRGPRLQDSKAQKQVLGRARGARLTSLENRASTPLPDDQHRRACEKGHIDRFSNSLLGGVPLPPTRLSTKEFQVDVQSKFGVGSTCLTPFTDSTLKSK